MRSWLVKMSQNPYKVGIFFVFVYALLFWNVREGVGNNWDWIFPYFRDRAPELFWKDITSWSSAGLGSAQSYAPSFLYQFLLLPLYYLPLQPETITYLILILSFSAGSYIAFRYFRKQTGFVSAVILSVAILVNPAIFYKLLAGHLVYVGAFIFYLALLFFLLDSYKPTVRNALILGVLLGLSAVQAQFAIYSLLTILLFFIYFGKFSFKYLLITLLTAFLIHFYWLSNFLFGSASVSQVSNFAEQGTFNQLERTSFFNIFRLTFTEATFINRFFPVGAQLVAVGVTLLGVVTFLKAKAQSKISSFYFGLWVIFALLAAGAYRDFQLPVVSFFYPLLREAGHAAPLVVVALVCLLSTSLVKPKPNRIALGLILALVLISVSAFVTSLPKVNNETVRAELKTASEFTDNSTHRILVYPFFNQYGFFSQEQVTKLGTPMSNSGWDSFSIFSGKEYLDNSTSVNGVQSKLLESYDLSVLEPFNVKYIYDFSKIYYSNADQFLPLEQYSEELIRRNNDENFIANLQKMNPGRLKKASENIYEIITAKSRVNFNSGKFWRVSKNEYLIQPDITANNQLITLASTYHEGWQLTVESAQSLPCETSIQLSVTECLDKNLPEQITSGQVVSTHYRDDNGLNSWTLAADDMKPGSQYRLIFEPDSRHSLALVVSGLALLIALIVISQLKRKDESN